MQAVQPVATVHLFPVLAERLFAVLRTLPPAGWRTPTIAGQWTVQDVAAHLLDTAVRRISAQRDGYRAPPPDRPVVDHGSMVAYLNQLNADWVAAMRRVSPQLLLGWLKAASGELNALLAALDPQAPAIWPVSWAGEELSQNWFDIGRELTERWIHAQQIMQAVGAPDLFDPALYTPVLDVFVRGLPHAYRKTDAPAGTGIRIAVDGQPDARWLLLRVPEGWALYRDEPGPVACDIHLDPDDAWKLFSKAYKSPEVVRGKLRLAGEAHLAEPLVTYAAVMA